MILFVNNVKNKWEQDNCIKRKMKKKESEFSANNMLNEEIKINTI